MGKYLNHKIIKEHNFNMVDICGFGEKFSFPIYDLLDDPMLSVHTVGWSPTQL